MIGVTNEKADRPSIADLQLYGLSLRTINALEEHFGFLYVDELEGLTEGMLIDMRTGGPAVVGSVRRALRRWLAEEPVMTEEQCAGTRQ